MIAGKTMRIIFIIAFSFVLLATIPLRADIIHIPGDYPTIQEGIDAANEHDTVLVKPGVYVENINFSGNNIIVASLFLTTSNPAYIDSTIIDGGQSGSVVKFENSEDSTAVIMGFTITNGDAEYGCGIRCVNSCPTISNNDIRDNGNRWYTVAGGGISCDSSNALIHHNLIHDNLAGCGGGIDLSYSSRAVISHNTIYDNYADW